MFYIGLYMYSENMKNYSCLKPYRYLVFGGPLPSLLKLGSWGQKWPYPGVSGLQSFMYSENMKKSSCLKPYGPES